MTKKKQKSKVKKVKITKVEQLSEEQIIFAELHVEPEPLPEPVAEPVAFVPEEESGWAKWWKGLW